MTILPYSAKGSILPAAGFAKSKVSVSQSPTTVVVASASTKTLPLSATSSFIFTVLPAAGLQNRILTRGSPSVSIKAFKGSASVPSTTHEPPHTSAAASFSEATTLFDPSVGSGTTADSAAVRAVPSGPKSAKTLGVSMSSKSNIVASGASQLAAHPSTQYVTDVSSVVDETGAPASPLRSVKVIENVTTPSGSSAVIARVALNLRLFVPVSVKSSTSAATPLMVTLGFINASLAVKATRTSSPRATESDKSAPL